jgi:hypothetical protein
MGRESRSARSEAKSTFLCGREAGDSAESPTGVAWRAIARTRDRVPHRALEILNKKRPPEYTAPGAWVEGIPPRVGKIKELLYIIADTKNVNLLLINI